MATTTNASDSDTFHVLITGVNSGLGFGICCRLIDEFLHLRPASQTLNLIITTRDQRKSDDAVRRITAHFDRTLRHVANTSTAGSSSKPARSRLTLQPEFLDLTSLASCQRLAARLVVSNPRIDVMILNAGMGLFVGLDWWGVVTQSVTDIVGAFTWPTYKIGAIGVQTKPQLVASGGHKQDKEAEPPLGEVFCANVFGHYILSHDLMPSLRQSPNGGRIIWVSSVEAYAHSFDPLDLQCLKTDRAYESSKRLTDILALTYTNPSTQASVSTFTSSSTPVPTTAPRPRLYVSHPGICASNIVYQHPAMAAIMVAVFYFMRLLGTIWHTVHPYVGATAPVWLALSPQSVLDDMEELMSDERQGGRHGEGLFKLGKWGSAADVWGNERVERTEVEGYGYAGVVEGEDGGGPVKKRKGRWKGAAVLTVEGREAFDALGVRCWREMEALRMEWTKRLDGQL